MAAAGWAQTPAEALTMNCLGESTHRGEYPGARAAGDPARCREFHRRWEDFLKITRWYEMCPTKDTPEELWRDGWLRLDERVDVISAIRDFDIHYYFADSSSLDQCWLVARVPRDEPDIVEFREPHILDWGDEENVSKEDFSKQTMRWPHAPRFIEQYTENGKEVWRFRRGTMGGFDSNDALSGATTVECSLCLEELTPGSRNTTVLKCGHVFHSASDCGCGGLLYWLKKNSMCPMCRLAV